MLNQNFVIIGALIGTAGAIAYLTDTIKGKVKPNRVSFLLWAIAPMIAFAAQIKQGVGLEALMTFTYWFFTYSDLCRLFYQQKCRMEINKV